MEWPIQTALLVARKEIALKGNANKMKYSAECRANHNTKTDNKSFENVTKPK
jgi:hypothetical protein